MHEETTRTAALAAGHCLGAYQIVDRLGAGGMGEVYRARDRRLGREVALKVLPAAKLNRESLQRFLQEGRSASRVNHPNIVAIHDVGEQDGIPYLVMEYVVGKPLSEAIPPAGWPAAVVLDYGRQMAAALAKAHAAGIVHRDLKPGNLMLTPEGAIKVLDFGLAKQSFAEADDETAAAATQAGAILGTAAYMAPEQALGRASDARSDIFRWAWSCTRC